MTITINPKHLIMLALISAIGISGYYFRDKIPKIFLSDAERTVDQALQLLMKNSISSFDEFLKLQGDNKGFSSSYEINIIAKSAYLKIDDWKLKTISSENGIYKIEVKGTVTNGFGAKLERNPIFIVEDVKKQRVAWDDHSNKMDATMVIVYGDRLVITDSYNFASIDKIKDANGKSDMEKFKMFDDMKNNVKVESLTFTSDDYNNSRLGHGTIVNNSNNAVSYVKLAIEYKDASDQIVNTDETYVISNDDLLPGQRRNFKWYTSNCSNCNQIHYELKFD